MANSASSYLMFLQENWTTNGLVGSGQECYGAAVTGANMTCISPTYGYDNLNRLTSASETLTRNPSSGTGYSRNFNYDEFGNMSVSAYSSNVPVSGLMPVTSPNTFNATNNQLKSATYDPRGNMTLVAAGSESMKYDGESRQIQTLDSGTGGTGTTNYLYDSAGQRVQKQIVGGATIVYVHDAFGQLVAEYNSAGITPVCTTCYLAYDQVGSVRLITDQKAGVVARHDYLPYGEEIPNGSAGRSSGNGFANNANLAQMFTGQERDGSTADLDYFNARHMSAYMGRFTQPDPANAGADIMNPQTWNAYAYVSGNPMGMTDPSGMFSSGSGTPEEDYEWSVGDYCGGYCYFPPSPPHYGGTFGGGTITIASNPSPGAPLTGGTSTPTESPIQVAPVAPATGTSPYGSNAFMSPTVSAGPEIYESGAIFVDIVVEAIAGIACVGSGVCEVIAGGAAVAAVGAGAYMIYNRYHPPPSVLPAYPDATKAKRKTPFGGGLRKRWKTADGKIIEWDYQHGKLEVYDSQGNHKGEFDPGTGEQTKPANPGRNVNP